MAEAGTVNAFLEELEGEKTRLENSVGHLQRSISELKEAIASEGDEDREFKVAIEEDIVVIAKSKARIERLDKEIQELKKGMQNLDGQVTVPVSEPPQPPPAPAAATTRKPDEAMPDASNTTNDPSGMYL